jgi:uncharacterized membrane protein
MEVLNKTVQVTCMVISVLGAIVVIWGVLEAIISFLSLKVSADKKNQISGNEAVRQRLGAHLLLGLELFIAGDIISSVVSPTWEKVGILGAIVAIRTVLSYFLRMEIRHPQG